MFVTETIKYAVDNARYTSILIHMYVYLLYYFIFTLDEEILWIRHGNKVSKQTVAFSQVHLPKEDCQTITNSYEIADGYLEGGIMSIV